MVRLPSFKKMFSKDNMNLIAGVAVGGIVVEPLLNQVAAMLPMPAFMGVQPDEIVKTLTGLWLAGTKKGIIKGIGVGLVATSVTRMASGFLGGTMYASAGNPVLVTPPSRSVMTNRPLIQTRNVGGQFF